jgi:hypothetical protein
MDQVKEVEIFEFLNSTISTISGSFGWNDKNKLDSNKRDWRHRKPVISSQKKEFKGCAKTMA